MLRNTNVELSQSVLISEVTYNILSLPMFHGLRSCKFVRCGTPPSDRKAAKHYKTRTRII